MSLRAAAFVLVIAVAAPAADPDEQQMQGVEVIPAVRTAIETLTPSRNTPDRPWADDIGSLTSHDGARAGLAVRNLIRHGARCLGDLAVVAKDRDARIRLRVVQVVGGIGGTEATPLALQLSRDPEVRLRVAAALALGRCRGSAVVPRLLDQLAAPDPDERSAAAEGLGAHRDPATIAPLLVLGQERDGLARQAMQDALDRCLQTARAAPVAIPLLNLDDPERVDALVTALAKVRDPRWSQPLAAIVASRRRAFTQLLAIRALASCGDATAIGALVDAAIGHPLPDLREQAAATLRILTGWQAGPGEAWRVWRRDHEAATAAQARRDAFLAGLHDPTVTADPAVLATFSTAELEPLVDIVLDRRDSAAWFPPLALAAVKADDTGRWIDWIGTKLTAETDARTRAGLVLLAHRIDAQRAGPMLSAARTQLEARVAAERKQVENDQGKGRKELPPDRGAERLAYAAVLALP